MVIQAPTNTDDYICKVLIHIPGKTTLTLPFRVTADEMKFAELRLQAVRRTHPGPDETETEDFQQTRFLRELIGDSIIRERVDGRICQTDNFNVYSGEVDDYKIVVKHDEK